MESVEIKTNKKRRSFVALTRQLLRLLCQCSNLWNEFDQTLGILAVSENLKVFSSWNYFSQFSYFFIFFLFSHFNIFFFIIIIISSTVAWFSASVLFVATVVVSSINFSSSFLFFRLWRRPNALSMTTYSDRETTLFIYRECMHGYKGYE